jgi:DNA polymerase III delta prime subunit
MNDLFANLRQNFTDSLSNEQVLIFLNTALNKGQLVSSYIFSGENSSSEKYLIAKELNKILNCERNLALIDNISNQPYIKENRSDKLSAPCNLCQNCKWLTENKHPKTPLLISLEQGKNIKIDNIKKLQDTLSQSSNFFRVIIIDPADYEYLNKHSANALLKSIEEPHPRTLYLLFASNSKSVLATLKSRSQCLQISPERAVNLHINEQSSEISFQEISSDSAHEISDPDEKNLHSILRKYHSDKSLSAKTKNLLFSEEVKKFKKEEVLEFCEELQGEFCKELDKRVSWNASQQTNQETANIKNLKDDISLIEKLETAKQELSNYVNTQAVIQRIGLF